MSAFAQLTNENIIELYYDERDIGNYTGCTYPLGTHLANYLWFDLKAINYEYQSLAKLNLTDSFAIDDNMFIDVLNRILTKIDSFCPYLHFHSQILIKAMLNAWKNKSIIAPIEILSLPKTDTMFDVDLFKPFFPGYYIFKDKEIYDDEDNNDLVDGIIGDPIPLTIEKMRDYYEFLITAVLLDIKEKREILYQQFDFIYNNFNNVDVKKLKPDQKLYLLELFNNHLIKNTKNNIQKNRNRLNTSYTLTSFKTKMRIRGKVDLPFENIDLIINSIAESNTHLYEVVEINDINDLMRYELIKMVLLDIPLRKCNHCGEFFVPSGRRDSIYCDRIMIGESRPCSKIGASKKYEDRIKTEPAQIAYKKMYKRLNARLHYGSLTKQQFSLWGEKAQVMRKKCLAQEISLEEFQAWLERSIIT